MFFAEQYLYISYVIPMVDELVIEAAGMTREVIRDGTVVETGEPKIRSCPLAKRFANPVDPITSEAVAANISPRIQRFGMRVHWTEWFLTKRHSYCLVHPN